MRLNNHITDKMIAKRYNINYGTLLNWKKKRPEVYLALRSSYHLLDELKVSGTSPAERIRTLAKEIEKIAEELEREGE